MAGELIGWLAGSLVRWWPARLLAGELWFAGSLITSCIIWLATKLCGWLIGWLPHSLLVGQFVDCKLWLSD